MRDAVEKYLEDVLCYADLAAADERNVRAELAEHVHSLMQSEQPAASNPKEVYAMLKDRIGNPKRLGRAIARAKGSVRTYFKKRVRKWPLQIAVVLVLALAVRCTVAEAFYVSGDGAAPVIPRGTRVLVYKLARTFNPGDVVVYRVSDGTALIGIVQGPSNSGWLIARDNGKVVNQIQTDRIVGRVFFEYRVRKSEIRITNQIRNPND